MGRRSIRGFKPEPVARKVIEAVNGVVNAAAIHHQPYSSCNLRLPTFTNLGGRRR